MLTAVVGDFLNFTWKGNHQVWKMPAGHTPGNCDFNGADWFSFSSGAVHQLGSTPGTTEYYSCPLHCASGMSLAVSVWPVRWFNPYGPRHSYKFTS